MDLHRHPLSSELFGELLNRPSPQIEAPAVIKHWVLVPDPGDDQASASIRDAIARLCQAHEVAGPGEDKHHHVRVGSMELRWEQHTEFSSVVLIGNGATDAAALPTDWLVGIRHKLLTGALISIHTPDTAPDGWLADWPNAVGGQVMSQAADIATTLRPNALGLVDYRIINHQLDPARLGRLTQRLYEVETYRMLALLGLPLAKHTGHTLNDLEQQLVGLVERLGATEDLSEDQRLLDELFGLAQTSEQLMANTDYRFSATQAYGRIVQDRLDEIGEQAIEHRQPLGEFLERRFEPALRTTANITRRQENLSARIARTVSLARTRVEVSLQTQHRTQLEAMAHRAQLQLRLQRTVEGLSVMAISYYTIGILAYLLGGWLPTDHVKWLISITSPVLLLGIWWLLKRWRKRLMEADDEAD